MEGMIPIVWQKDPHTCLTGKYILILFHFSYGTREGFVFAPHADESMRAMLQALAVQQESSDMETNGRWEIKPASHPDAALLGWDTLRQQRRQTPGQVGGERLIEYEQLLQRIEGFPFVQHIIDKELAVFVQLASLTGYG